MKKGFLIFLFSSLLFCTLYAQDSQNYYSVRTITLEDGTNIDEIIISGPPTPPPGYERPVAKNRAINILSDVPAFDWSFGCSATSAAMQAGYYDRTCYTNMYTGPGGTPAGVMPLDNSEWPDWEDSHGDTLHQCPLSATHNGLDGRIADGHVDDYWDYYGQPGPDPWVGGTQHTYGECTGDYMKTNQWINPAPQNTDGSTTFYNYTDGSPLPWDDMETYGIDVEDGGYGLKLFYESRNYTVTNMYNQYIKGQGTNPNLGFTYDQFKAEIDAGRPVMIHVTGHTMVGFGYDDQPGIANDLIYIHDTWDYIDHTMIWGGSYSGMDHYGVTIVLLNAPASDPTIINVTSGSITQTEVGLEWSGSSPEFRVVRTPDGPAASPSNGTLIYEGSATSTTDTGLTANTSYFYTVYGKSSGSSTYSSGNKYLCVVTEATSGATTASVPAGQTGEFTFGTTGSVIDITINGDPDGGTINSQKFDYAPSGNNTISGSATAPDASTVTPDIFSNERYWTVTSDLTGTNAFTVYFDISGLSGINDPDKLLILKRDAGGWVAQNTSRDGNMLYSDITSFSDFVIGAESGDNPLPVTLSSFSVQFSNGAPTISWTTQSETNNLGWNIYRSASQNTGQMIQINFYLIPGAGTTTEPTSYIFQDEYEVIQGSTYWYSLESVDDSGKTSIYGPISLFIPYSEEEPEIIPVITILKTNYPNPFNPNTLIRFDVKNNETAILTIFNIKGQIILTEQFESGKHDYEWDAQEQSSGIYFYRLESESYSEVKKMVLVK